MNRIALATLESGADFLLKIDDDTVPLFNPLDYVGENKDVLGFPYPTWRANAEKPLIWFPREPDGGGLVEVPEV
ncbi:MAG: hypothetical protein GTO22_20690, partial [Gemmatimonadales bacterium]|nr:hypothetical protein [Gemmatimonadales bacterium]